MIKYVDKAGLSVAEALARFIEERALPGTGLRTDEFWRGMARIYAAFTVENEILLDTREAMQEEIDTWHQVHSGRPVDQRAYQEFLRAIDYLVPEPAPFRITVENVDDEIARVAGPQLVVPVLNTRFLLNAVNSRWGSLYDALYGSDAIPGDRVGGYDPRRGAKVIAWAKAFLDRSVPLAEGSHASTASYRVVDARLAPALADPSAFAGYRGAAHAPSAILLCHHGLHIELVIDRAHPVGKDDPAGVCDVVLEAALTTIVDLEDSVAAVDADDKVAAYTNWLGLMSGDIDATFEKNGHAVRRSLAADRSYAAPGGAALTLPGRSLLLVRNVGHHMRTPAVRLANGAEAHEGILDGIVSALIAMHDLKRRGSVTNSRAGSIYIVKPKMHGPAEASFTNRLFNAIEDLLSLRRHTIKVGVMDEERRTSANLAACIAEVKERIVFVNTGFLDRTGDEIHTSMNVGPTVRKSDMKKSAWLQAYEDRNVRIALACGFAGKAQIGKGMWAMPDRMGDMLQQKAAHPEAGANTAWVPSPTAATLHATHYHDVDVFARQRSLAGESPPDLDALLTIALGDRRSWSRAEIHDEIDSNAQSILGYVVRWIDQGIGCSKVPDLHDVGLMEDRATLRISSQLLANWLHHGVCSAAEVDAALVRMARKVDAQNAGDPGYRPMGGRESVSLAVQAARALIFQGMRQPNGYTEALLHAFRRKAKARIGG